jgi:hypothetical protein
VLLIPTSDGNANEVPFAFKRQPGATEPSMLVVGDLDDIFLPKPADLLVSLSEARTCLESLLSRLSDMFKDNHNVGNAMSSALQSAYKLIVRLNFLILQSPFICI